ncbi:MAG: YicC/YloC family endoribonuclease [Planctomycetota bacterium]
MIRSMTGYGSASAERRGVHFLVELRSLNNRYFKAATRLPEQLAGLEGLLESTLRKRVSRGSFALTVKLRVSDHAATSSINDAALLTYLDHLETVRDKVGDEAVQIDLTQLLNLPGVLEPNTDDDALLSLAKAELPALLGEATDRLLEMRQTEGRALADDLLTQRDAIREQAALVAERAPVVLDEYHSKLAARVGELTAKAKLKVDENDLIREVAVYADRADISEELARLSEHLNQLGEIIAAGDGGEPAGRTLDFIAQEMLREANTLGSKSNDTQISKAVVEIKSRIDRIKEQVQNVE